jgi:DNA ligase N terminus
MTLSLLLLLLLPSIIAAACCSVRLQALAAATGRKEAALRAEYEACGDLGSVAAECRSRQRTMFTPPPLTVAGVLKSFRDIARCVCTCVCACVCVHVCAHVCVCVLKSAANLTPVQHIS